MKFLHCSSSLKCSTFAYLVSILCLSCLASPSETGQCVLEVISLVKEMAFPLYKQYTFIVAMKSESGLVLEDGCSTCSSRSLQLSGITTFSCRCLYLTGDTVGQQQKSLPQMTFEIVVAQLKAARANISVAHIVSDTQKSGGELCSRL